MHEPGLDAVVVNTILLAMAIGALLFVVVVWYSRQLSGYIAAKFAARAEGLKAMEEAQQRVRREESIRFGLRVAEPEPDPPVVEEPVVEVAPSAADEPAATPAVAAASPVPRKRRIAAVSAPPPPRPLAVRVLRALLAHVERG